MDSELPRPVEAPNRARGRACRQGRQRAVGPALVFKFRLAAILVAFQCPRSVQVVWIHILMLPFRSHCQIYVMFITFTSFTNSGSYG